MPYRHDHRFELQHLTPAERLVAGALVRTVLVGGDYHRAEIRGEVEALAKEMDPMLFWNALHDASQLDELDTIDEMATAITRQQARVLIFTLVNQVAMIGGINRTEAALLEALRTLWDIEIEPLSEP